MGRERGGWREEGCAERSQYTGRKACLRGRSRYMSRLHACPSTAAGPHVVESKGGCALGPPSLMILFRATRSLDIFRAHCAPRRRPWGAAFPVARSHNLRDGSQPPVRALNEDQSHAEHKTVSLASWSSCSTSPRSRSQTQSLVPAPTPPPSATRFRGEMCKDTTTGSDACALRSQSRFESKTSSLVIARTIRCSWRAGRQQMRGLHNVLAHAPALLRLHEPPNNTHNIEPQRP